MRNLFTKAALTALVLVLSACASTKDITSNAQENVDMSAKPAQMPKLNSGQFVQALETVKSQNSGDAIVRAEDSAVCERLYQNYALMAQYAPAANAAAPKKGNPIANIFGSTLEVASGVAGIAGIAGGTDTLLKTAQVSNALDGTNTILGLFKKNDNGAVTPAVKTLNVNEMAFSKGFQLNCPLAPMKTILEQ